jgi:hypothetical protein
MRGLGSHAFQAHDAWKVTGERQRDPHQQHRPHQAGDDRLIHHAVGHVAIAGADEAGRHGGGADRHEAEDVADQPQGVNHERHRSNIRLAGQEVAGQPQVHEADEQMQHLFKQHRRREPQHGAEGAGRVDEGRGHEAGNQMVSR